MSVPAPGYVKLVELYGSDERIIEAARMSTAKGFLGWEPGPCPDCDEHSTTPPSACRTCEGKGELRGDAVLLRYLYKNKHMTPFEMAGAIIEVQAPIFVFREWHRHRTQSYNELSARYTPLPPLDYAPTIERCLGIAGKNKQAGTAKGSDKLTPESAFDWLEELAQVYEHAERVYQSGLRRGVPKELARLSVPVGRYSRMRAHANLRNWLQFLTLRMDEAAQWEIRQYANGVYDLLAEAFPRTMGLFDEANQ